MRPGDTTRYMTPKVPLHERARPTTSCRPGPLTRRASRSEAMMVAVDFSPRTQGVSCSGVAERRLKITVLFDRSAVVPRRRIVCSPRSVGSSPRLPSLSRSARWGENVQTPGPGPLTRSRGFISQRHVSGFTLIELVISAALTAMILVSAYVCLSACYSSQDLIEPRIDAFQNARVAMGLITADLRAACVLSKESEFVGMRRRLGDADADNLDFATHNYTPRHARQGDYCQVSYFLEQDPQTGKMSLWRRRNPTIGLDPFSGGDREEIATGVLGLRLEYYDGLDWFDTWGDSEGRGKQQYSLLQRSNLYGLPDAVRITMSFDPNPRPTTSANATTNEPALVFRTVARVNLSAALQRSSSPGSGGATETGGQTTAGPGGGN